MNKAITLALPILGMLLLLSCNSNHHSGEIELNNGEKWKVNEEMKPHIIKGSEILAEYIAQEDTDYESLAESLKTQNKNLIKSCTMKGESHDQLHKWLHPHMGLIANLSKADDLEEAKGIISQIDESFNTYQAYFE